MTGVGNGPALIWGVVMIVVLVSSLVARRIPVGQFVRYALAWAAIFLAAYGVLLFRDEIGMVWDRARADLTGAHVAQVRGSETVLRRAGDGHFWAEGSVDGQAVRFLVDSGATMTAISPAGARALGLDIDRARQPIVVMTANGPANSWPATLPSLTIGNITVESVAVLVTDEGNAVNLLGMNWLNRLSGWRVEGREMILTP